MDCNGNILQSRSFTYREIYKMVREQQIMIIEYVPGGHVGGVKQ